MTSCLFLLFFMLLTIIKSDINILVIILFVHLSSIILENYKVRALIIPEILEIIELHNYKFGLVINFSDTRWQLRSQWWNPAEIRIHPSVKGCLCYLQE